jgi:VWFA-related protein
MKRPGFGDPSSDRRDDHRSIVVGCFAGGGGLLRVWNVLPAGAWAMKVGLLVGCLGGAICLMGFSSWAQDAAGNAPRNPAQSGAESIPLFRTQANLVVVDVVVRDHSQPVRGLKAEDFRLLEDGQPQTIVSFEEHRSTDTLEVSGPPPQLGPDTYSDAPRYAITSAANVLLLDALNTPLADQVYVRRRMLAYLKSVPPGTRMAVFTLGSQLRIIEGFTADSSVLEKALTEGRGHAEKSPVMDPDWDQTLSDAAAFAGNGMAEFAAESRSFEAYQRREMTIDALTQMGRYLSTIPGRKNLIWFTASFPFALPSGGDQVGNQGQAGQLAQDFTEQLQKLAELLTLARVAVYPVDARGLIDVPSHLAETNVINPAMMNSLPVSGSPNMNQGPGTARSSNPLTAKLEGQDRQFLADLGGAHLAMDQFARATGGKAYYNTNGVTEAMGDAIANGSNYYTLSYTPENRNYNGAFRNVKVELVEGHYDVVYRPGYFAADPAQSAKLIPGRLTPLIAAMQHGVLPVTQVPFTVKVIPAANDPAAAQNADAHAGGMLSGTLQAPVTRYIAEFSIEPSGLDFRPAGNGKNHREIELTQVVYDQEGIRLNYNDVALAVDTPAAAEANPQARIQLRQEIDVPPGQSWLRIGVNDRMSGRMGTLEIGLNVAK